MVQFLKNGPWGMLLIVLLFWAVDMARYVFPVFAPYAHLTVFVLLLVFAVVVVIYARR